MEIKLCASDGGGRGASANVIWTETGSAAESRSGDAGQMITGSERSYLATGAGKEQGLRTRG